LSKREGRGLTRGEISIAQSMFGSALRLDPIRLHRTKWWPLQPRNVVMAPCGAIWFHPQSPLWRDDFATAPPRLQALFVHELAHVWQHQRGIRLLLKRHPFCRYDYRIDADRPLERYGIEQQATIIEHAFLARSAGTPDPALDELLARARLGG
jgi:hypothetical protein